jgi:hypothetical protein
LINPRPAAASARRDYLCSSATMLSSRALPPRCQ